MKHYTHILNGASLAGVASFSMYLLVFYAFGLNPIGPIKFLGVAIPITFFVLSLKKYRDETLEGNMPFSAAVTPGMLFSFIYASLTAALFFFFMNYIDSAILDLNKLEQLKQLGQTKDLLIEYLGKEKYELAIEELKNMQANTLAISDFFSKFLTVVVFNLVIGAIMRQTLNTTTLDE